MNQNLNNIYLDYNQGQGTCDSTPFCLKIMCKVAKFLAAKVLDNPFMTYIYIHPFWIRISIIYIKKKKSIDD
jgi:hypothetical protein